MAILALHLQTANLDLALFSKTSFSPAKISFRDPNSSQTEEAIARWLKSNTEPQDNLEMIIIGGITFPGAREGLYLLDDLFFRSLRKPSESADLTGLLISQKLAKRLKLPAYAVDPFISGEGHPYAHITGTPELERNLRGDSFVFKFLAKREAEKRNIEYKNSRLIIAHLNQEFQIGAVVGGKILDLSNSQDEGPFAWQQAGGLPFGALLEVSAALGSEEKTLELVSQKSGIRGYLKIESLEQLGWSKDPRVQLVVKAMVYQISKEIGAYGAVLRGKVDGIVLAGELMEEETLRLMLKNRIGFLANPAVYPQNQVFPALLAAAARIKSKQEPILTLEGAD